MVPHAPNALSGDTMALRMAVRTRPWTRRDLERLPDDGNKYEVIRGQLFVTPLPRPDHDGVVRSIADRLREFVRVHDLGVISERTALVLDESEAQPDLVVRRDPHPRPRDWSGIPAPILVVEVLSDTTGRRDRIWKRDYYAESGIPEYWIVDADARSITVVRADEPDSVVSSLLTWKPPGTDVSLDIDVAALFRDALD
jgi:Uma2 family endonuclease